MYKFIHTQCFTKLTGVTGRYTYLCNIFNQIAQTIRFVTPIRNEHVCMSCR